MPGRMEIRFDWKRTPDGEPEGDGTSFAILAIAPWRGSAPARGPLDARRAVRVDVESFDQLFARIAPRVVIEGYGEGGANHILDAKSLDDFHPDALLRNVPGLRSLASLLTVARDPETFRSSTTREPSTARTSAAEDDAATLSRLLGRAPESGMSAATSAQSAVDRLVRAAVEPYIVASPDPRQAEVVAGLEAAIAAALRVVLRQPALQALEARWRSLRRLVFGVESEGPIRIYALDATPDEWAADLAAGGDASPPALRRALEGAVSRDALGRVSLIVLDAEFGAGLGDVAALQGWGALAAALGSVIIAGAHPSLVGATAVADLDDPARWARPDAQAWSALRRSPVASCVALALPRVLARAPYGVLTDPIETIPFEEASDDPGDSGFVWSVAAWSCAELIAAAAGAEHEAPLSVAGTIEDLPFAIFTAGGGRKIRSFTEVLLPDRAAEAMLDAGLVPAVANPSVNSIRVPRLQSIADPPQALGAR